jgi:nucleoside-diphosphate-sugar epimerase
LPVVEDDLISPVNTYGRSKAAGEWFVAEARAAGLQAGCIRLPSVYGSANDIPQRVIPAFVAGALQGRDLRLTGAGQVCDFLHVTDAIEGIVRMAKRLDAGTRNLPTVHLASGRGTSLGELARLVTRLAESQSAIIEEPARSFDVSGFVGDPARAADVLDWKPSTTLEDGLARLISGHASSVRRGAASR